MIDDYEVIIGLEIHVELKTQSKMFCSCSAEYFGEKPNTHTCPVCLGLPGAMPVANLLAIQYSQMLGMAVNCDNPLNTKFDRKNYFYPDLPKGFQISQYDLPFSQNGFTNISIKSDKGIKSIKRIGITRAHLEEDTGKLTHATVDGKKVTLIDYNRSSVPLLEIVSEPDMRSAEEAKAYAQKIHQIVRYIGISDADMEEGSMRIEPNVSLCSRNNKNTTNNTNNKLPSYKVELKNINSFKFAEKAINFEIKRQAEILDRGETPIQETRGWNENKNETVSQRSKEEAHDYRYFPEPDIPPFVFAKKYIDGLKAKIPELPDAKLERFQKDYQLSEYDAEILTRDIEMADYFDEATKAGKEADLTPKQIANVIINKKPDIGKILPATLVKDIKASSQKATVNQNDLNKAVEEVISENKKAAEDYMSGKENILMFLVGQVMRKLEGKADANEVKEALIKELKK
ncbi:MAG TPA: Asp-tRNA(Asn)/Glu-tRNA(Gln) amidotransferase subunit GatB [Candidatus Saccharimonadales bacterium]|nr:Asp-tRNA(Asn)/Glu-tRNA(Gln) amidotransferase subunit GatB [Candidatus Saccharimonadales bacterium]